MSLAGIVCTGVVSALSIPVLNYPVYLKTIRNYLAGSYLLMDLFSFSRGNVEYRIQISIHHLITLYLIYNQNTAHCNHLVDELFFLEFGAFLFLLTKYLNCFKEVSKLYWIYDRAYKFPHLITNNLYCTKTYLYSIMTLNFLGILWTFEMLKFKKLKYVFSLVMNFIIFYECIFST